MAFSPIMLDRHTRQCRTYVVDLELGMRNGHSNIYEYIGRLARADMLDTLPVYWLCIDASEAGKQAAFRESNGPTRFERRPCRRRRAGQKKYAV